MLLLGFVSSAYSADLIPADRRVEWTPGSTVGVFGGIPSNRTEWTNIVTAGADPTGVVDATAIIQALLNACPAHKYVYAPAGTYKISSPLNAMDDFVSLKGAGKGVTIFRPASKFVNLDNQTLQAPFRIVGSLAKGATNLTTLNTDLTGTEGYNLAITGSNDGRTNVNVFHITYQDRNLKQIIRIDSVSNGTNINFWPPLYWDYPTDVDPWLQINSSNTKGIGFEDFTVEGGTSESFTIFGGTDYFIRNVNCLNPGGFAMNLGGNLFMQVEHCGFTSTNYGSGSAVILTTATCGSLFQNNYSIGGSPMYEINGSSGNVMAWSYATNAVSDDTYVGNPFSIHGPHSMMNLWEGLNGTMYQSDGYFGSASHNTLYKNYFHTKDPDHSGLPRCIDLNRWSTYFNVIGNVLGHSSRSGWHYEITNAFYDQAKATIFRFGFGRPGSAYHLADFGEITPQTDWRWPGQNHLCGVVTQTVTVATNRIPGTFTNITVGQQVAFQSSANTNYYYPRATNVTLTALAVTDIQPAYLEFNRDITATNNHVLYKIGDGLIFQAYHRADFFTHFLHGNWDMTNQVTLWSTNGLTTESNLPPSLYLASWPPAWWTNRAGSVLDYPVNPTNGVTGDWAARSMFEDAAPSSPASGTSAKTGQGRPKGKGPRGRFFQP